MTGEVHAHLQVVQLGGSEVLHMGVVLVIPTGALWPLHNHPDPVMWPAAICVDREPFDEVDDVCEGAVGSLRWLPVDHDLCGGVCPHGDIPHWRGHCDNTKHISIVFVFIHVPPGKQLTVSPPGEQLSVPTWWNWQWLHLGSNWVFPSGYRQWWVCAI